jgi:hypothetical protein
MTRDPAAAIAKLRAGASILALGPSSRGMEGAIHRHVPTGLNRVAALASLATALGKSIEGVVPRDDRGKPGNAG